MVTREMEIKAEDDMGRVFYVEAKLLLALPFFLRAGVRRKVIDLVRMIVDFERNSAVIDELNWDEFYKKREELGWKDGEERGASFFAHVAAETCQLSRFTFEFYSPKRKDYYVFALTEEERPPRLLVFQITENDQKRLQLLLKARATEMAKKESEAIVIEELLIMKAAAALSARTDAEGAEVLREHGINATVSCPVAIEEGYADVFYVPMPHGTYALARFIDYETAEVHTAWRRIDPTLYSEDDERVKELLRRFLEP